MDLIGLLKMMNVICRDNGKEFTNAQRLDVIVEKLQGTGYICENGKLFRLYSRKPVEKIDGKLLLVSSHVDCETGITECFSNTVTEELLMGTYDNSITNTAILSLMMEGSLPDQVVVAFTGDEEGESRGAAEVTKCLHKKDKKFETIVLDVTDFGWSDGADFTMENSFWKDKMGMKVCNTADEIGYPWLFVPKDLGRIPAYIHERRIFPEAAEPDESWKYKKLGIRCFSLCFPVQGPMHTNQGVIARLRSFYRYVEALRHICATLSDVPIAR